MSSSSGVSVDLGYIKSPPGILKIAEFVLLLIAFACLGDTNAFYHNSAYHFAMFIMVTLWLLVIGLFILFLLQLHLKINLPWVIVLMVFHAVGSFALLISSSLIADDATDHHDVADNTILKGWCEVNNVCALYDAATAFGFFSMIAFILDTAFYIWKFMNARRGGEGGAGGEKPPADDKPVEPQPIA